MKKVLLIGTELVFELRKLLEQDKEHFSVLYCAKGDQGLKIIAEENIDVIITELFLPDTNGLHIATVSRCIYGRRNRMFVVTRGVSIPLGVIEEFLQENNCLFIRLGEKEEGTKSAYGMIFQQLEK